MPCRRTLLAAVAAGLLLLSTAPGQATTPEGATRHIQALGDQAIAIIQRSDISLAQREAAFRQILQQGFAVQAIARFVLGKHWRRATPSERSDFTELFSEFMLKSFSQRLGGYQGENFIITGARPAGKRDVLVSTRIERPSGPPVEAGWRVREVNGQYRILDVMVQGVSMAITQRDEFSSVVQREGISGLIQVLRAKTQRLSVAGS